MKKLIVLLLSIIISTSLIFSQQKANYLDINKKDTVTVSIIAKDTESTVHLASLQSDLAKYVENQGKVNGNLSTVLTSIANSINTYVKEVEERNKSDGKLITNYFGYNEDEVLNILHNQNIINYTLVGLALLYFLFVVNSQLRVKMHLLDFIRVFAYYTIYGFVGFILMKFLITGLFNKGFYIIKELTKLYS